MKVLIVDDDIAYAKELKSAIQIAAAETAPLFEVVTIDLLKRESAELLRDHLSDPSPAFMLIDRILAAVGTSVLPYIETAAAGISRQQRIPAYVLTGYDFTPEEKADVLEKWREGLGKCLDLRGTLAKPIRAEILLPLILDTLHQKPSGFDRRSDDGQVTLESIVRTLRIPARHLGPNQGGFEANDRWVWGGNDPDPERSSEGMQFIRNTPREDGTMQLIAYQLATARTRLGGELQIAMPFDHQTSSNFDFYLDSMFLLLRQIGFTRMRYFKRHEVPGSDGVISLEKWFGVPGPVEVKGQDSWRKGDKIYASSRGYLANRFQMYDTNHLPLEFIRQIVKIEDEIQHATDSGLKFWNAVVGLGEFDEWLEFPVLCQSYPDGEKFQAYGMVIADRLGKPSSRIDPNRIEGKAVSLRLYCRELSRIIEANFERRRSTSLEQARSFFLENAPQANDPMAFNKYLTAIVEKAREIAGADLALISWIPPSSSRATTKAVSIRAGQIDSYVNVTRLMDQVVEHDNFPAMAAAIETGEEFFRPDGLREGEGSASVLRIYSRLGIPLKLGNRVIGALGFVDRRIRRFNRPRIDDVNRLVQNCAAVIEYLGAASFRSEWETTLLHEVRKFAGNAKSELDDIDSANENLQLAKQMLERLIDRSRAFNRITGQGNTGHSELIDPSEILRKELMESKIYAKKISKTFNVESACTRAVVISAEKAGLEFIIRTLLDNAVDHGAEGSAVIWVREETNARSWALTVVNEGQMTEEEDRTKFDAYTRLSNARNVRSHIALAASLRWVEAHGARLTVDNDSGEGSPRVIARLVWPRSFPKE